MDRIPVKLHRPVYWLKSQSPDLAYASAERHGPCAPGNVVPSRRIDGAGRIPVRRHDWPTRQVIAFIQVVVDEVLQQHLVHIRSMRGTGDGEQVVDQNTDRPMSRLHQCYHRRPNAELTLTRLRARSSWQNECRSRSVDELPGIRRGQ